MKADRIPQTDQAAAKDIALKALNALDPETLLPQFLSKLTLSKNIFLLAIGKAAWKMADTVQKFSEHSALKGIVLTTYGSTFGNIPGLDIYEAGHPFPDENSLKYTELIIDFISQLSREDHLLILLSGGGSALLEKPLPGITLQNIIEITRSLMHAGADIYELNTLRKHLSAVKGGRLAELIKCKSDVLILSDVIGDDLSVIASGPVVGDRSTSRQVKQIMEKYNIPMSSEVEAVIVLETPDTVENMSYYIVGNNKLLCEKAAELAEAEGFSSYLYPAHLQGEATVMGRRVGEIVKQLISAREITAPCAVILGGETTVTVTGKGRGGRNLELLLSAAKEIRGMENVVVLALASDGIDGNSPAAGGIIDGRSYQKITSIGEDLKRVLQMNDSYNLMKKLDAVLETGPTGTNVNDLVIILIG